MVIMKTLYLFLALIFAVYLCTYDTNELSTDVTDELSTDDTDEDSIIYIEPVNPISACGVNDPLNELEWLHDLIIDTKEMKGWFVEHVWTKKNYDQKDIFVITICPSSIALYLFDCQGNAISVGNDVQYWNVFVNSLTDNDLIYSDPLFLND